MRTTECWSGSGLQLYYYRDPIGNFGDDLNPWLWPRLLGRSIEKCFDDDTLFVGIGSVLNERIPPSPPKKVVVGSGCGYGSLPAVTSRWQFYWVRGPLTARALNLPPSMAICDGAALVRERIEPAPGAGRAVAFMPHHLTACEDDWRVVCESLGIRYLDAASPVEATIEGIRTSGVLITEAMHGAIVADALRVPWIAARTRRRINEFKWRDWTASLRLEHRFEWLPPIWSPACRSLSGRMLHPVVRRVAQERLRWLVRFGPRHLSRERAFRDVYTRLVETFGRMAEAACRA